MGLVLPVFLIVLAAGVARLATRPRAADRPVATPSPELQAIARTTGRARLAGVAAGVVVGLAAAYQGGLGRGLLLAAPLFALCVLAGVLMGELVVGTPGGAVRHAALEVRRIRDYVPRALGSAVLAAGALLAPILVLTTATGSPDDLGRAGRDLFRRCSATLGQGAGPWPGSYYTLPLSVVVLCGLVAAGGVLMRVVRRPLQSEDRAVDEALRGSAAGAVTAAIGLLIAVPLAGICAVAASAVVDISCRPAWWTVGAVALAAVAVASLGLAAWCLSVLASREPRVVHPAVPADR